MQDLKDLEESVRSLNPGAIAGFESSCFSGRYVTSEVTPAYLAALEAARSGEAGTGGAFSPSKGGTEDGAARRGDGGGGSVRPCAVPAYAEETSEPEAVTPVGHRSQRASPASGAAEEGGDLGCEAVSNAKKLKRDTSDSALFA